MYEEFHSQRVKKFRKDEGKGVEQFADRIKSLVTLFYKKLTLFA